MTVNRRFFRITIFNKGTIDYTKIRNLYDAHKEDIGASLGTVMNAVCKRNCGTWSNKSNTVTIERFNILSVIEKDGQYEEVNV